MNAPQAEDFRPIARYLTQGLFLPGGEREDLEQEAMLGVVQALRSFDPAQGASLRSHVFLIARRRIVDALKAAHRHHAAPLNDSIRQVANDDGEIVPILDTLTSGLSAEDEALAAIAKEELLARVTKLSARERHVVVAHAVGLSYAEILEGGIPEPARQRTRAAQLKSVDNALARGRSRLRRAA